MTAELITGRVIVERYIPEDGGDVLVSIHTDDGAGEPLAVVDALGMLQLAMHDVLHPQPEDQP